ncbi:acyl-CoA dehydrogenase family protein [Streptomyces sp. NPDC048389]|uniref:acyl-CoA dehydrogenase family protein n=1 Tax=Streptomyces sp. NPDC048389 TaxID=3154622 RepID=UPI003451E77B
MDAVLTAEQDEVRRTVREALTGPGAGPGGPGGPGASGGPAPETWARLALPGLALPTAYGGAGRPLAALAVAAEEAGRVLLPSPLLATAGLAAPLVLALGSPEQRAALLPRIADTTLTCTLAVPGRLGDALALTGDNTNGTWAGGGRAGGIQARRTGDDWTLYGEAPDVLDGHGAGLLLVAAHTGGFPRSRALLFQVEGDAPGLTRAPLTTLDATRPRAALQLRDCPAALLGTDGADVPAALAATGRGAAALLAAEAAGAAGGVLSATAGHITGREADRHRLADLYAHVQGARSAAYYAAWDTAAGPPALAQALEALRTVAGEAVRLAEGARDRAAHRYVGRAAADETLFGPVHRLRDAAAERAGLFTPEGTAA